MTFCLGLAYTGFIFLLHRRGKNISPLLQSTDGILVVKANIGHVAWFIFFMGVLLSLALTITLAESSWFQQVLNFKGKYGLLIQNQLNTFLSCISNLSNYTKLLL